MSTCYLLVWVSLDPATLQLVVTSAGFYSEAPGSITHDIQNNQPLLMLSMSAPSYGRAAAAMRQYCEERVHLEMGIKQPLSIHAQICKRALSRQG